MSAHKPPLSQALNSSGTFQRREENLSFQQRVPSKTVAKLADTAHQEAAAIPYLALPLGHLPKLPATWLLRLHLEIVPEACQGSKHHATPMQTLTGYSSLKDCHSL